MNMVGMMACVLGDKEWGSVPMAQGIKSGAPSPWRMKVNSLVIFISTILAGCGGGGGGGESSTPVPATGAAAVVVAADVDTQVPTSGVGLKYIATVYLKNQGANGTRIDNAAVVINGATLAYSPMSGRYSSLVNPDASGRLNLTVITADGDVITASASAITSLPILNMPNPFSVAIDNPVSWNRPAGMEPSRITPEYMIQLESAAYAYPRHAMVAGTSAIFPAGCCVPGAHTLILYSRSICDVPGANPSSTFSVTATVRTSVNFI